MSVYMDTFEVEYQDTQTIQFTDTVEGESHRDAAQTSVDSEDRIGATEQDNFQVRVYPAGNPEEDEIFSYVELI